MPLTTEDKKNIISKFGANDKDTGNTSVQIALLTEQIEQISNHLKGHKKDFAGEKGLLTLVGQRKKRLAYLKRKNLGEYQKITKELKIRK